MGVNFSLKNKLHNNKGFTLIEVVIAMAVIAIGMFAMMNLTIVVSKGTSHSRKVTSATNIAEDTMEGIKRNNYLNVVNGTGITDNYLWVVTVQNNTPGVNMKTVTVNVYWSPAVITSTHNVQLQTIISPAIILAPISP